jgi:(S)-2-hydroxyglutarate dehydrogenase
MMSDGLFTRRVSSFNHTVVARHGTIRLCDYRWRHSRVVFEKEDGWARHQTGRNCGVIHSGVYYKPGSLKANLYREENRKLMQFCEIHGIRYERCGKVIVASTHSDLPAMNFI